MFEQMTPEQIMRRLVEAVMAAVLLAVAAPVIVGAAIASALCYRAWPFFVHERIGLHGRPFRFVKIRTLPPSTNRYADKYAIGAAELSPVMQAMRRLHLDELPQLLHVVRGQMAFVGPRPEMPILHAQLPSWFAERRVSVLPGLTCLWQISPHCDGLIGERMEYDRLYVDHRTTQFDLWILMRTAVKMTLGRRVHLFQVPQWVVGACPPVVAPSPHRVLDVTVRPVRSRAARPPVVDLQPVGAGVVD